MNKVDPGEEEGWEHVFDLPYCALEIISRLTPPLMLTKAAASKMVICVHKDIQWGVLEISNLQAQRHTMGWTPWQARLRAPMQAASGHSGSMSYP